mmetsp:Transcript_22646/g.53473  ORF Transcript_22646/g.53473 Transcript_22646/m.53473 type:complete len:218 (-) Transcript_22646:201-854(-)
MQTGHAGISGGKIWEGDGAAARLLFRPPAAFPLVDSAIRSFVFDSLFSSENLIVVMGRIFRTPSSGSSAMALPSVGRRMSSSADLPFGSSSNSISAGPLSAAILVKTMPRIRHPTRAVGWILPSRSCAKFALDGGWIQNDDPEAWRFDETCLPRAEVIISGGTNTRTRWALLAFQNFSAGLTESRTWEADATKNLSWSWLDTSWFGRFEGVLGDDDE